MADCLCLRAHRTAVAPWSCDCSCHTDVASVKQPEDDAITSRLRQLIATWRSIALTRVESGPTAIRHCADELETLLDELENA